MIQEFIISWPLFQNTYLAGWLSSGLLALIGVLVVARDQIFVSAAVSQASALGIALAMWAGEMGTLHTVQWLRSDTFLSAMAVGFAVLAAIMTASRADTKATAAEGITGWVFLVSASTSTLLFAHSPHGLEEIHRLLSSSLIGASRSDVWRFAGLSGITALALIRYHRPVLLVALDPPMALAVGLRVGLWALLTVGWLGLAVGLTMRATGMLFTFGCLVLPALLAKQICREVRTMFVIAPLVTGLLASVAFLLANFYDYPPAQMTVALLSAAVAAVWIARRLLGRA